MVKSSLSVGRQFRSSPVPGRATHIMTHTLGRRRKEGELSVFAGVPTLIVVWGPGPNRWWRSSASHRHAWAPKPLSFTNRSNAWFMGRTEPLDALCLCWVCGRQWLFFLSMYPRYYMFHYGYCEYFISFWRCQTLVSPWQSIVYGDYVNVTGDNIQNIPVCCVIFFLLLLF